MFSSCYWRSVSHKRLIIVKSAWELKSNTHTHSIRSFSKWAQRCLQNSLSTHTHTKLHGSIQTGIRFPSVFSSLVFSSLSFPRASVSGFALALPLLHFPNTQRRAEAWDFHQSIDTDPSACPSGARVRPRPLCNWDSHTHTHTFALTVAYLQSNSWRTKKDLSWIYSPPILDKFPTFSFASQTRPNRKI